MLLCRHDWRNEQNGQQTQIFFHTPPEDWRLGTIWPEPGEGKSKGRTIKLLMRRLEVLAWRNTTLTLTRYFSMATLSRVVVEY
jgi:hypothetical protein